MNSLKKFLSLFSFTKSKRRRTRAKKQKRSRHTRRYKMRGGWGGDASVSIPIIENPDITYLKYKGVGGWGPAINTP